MSFTKQDVVVIDYNAGNIRSVIYALDRLGQKYRLSSDPEAINNSDKVIFPGVGEASTTMDYLTKTGLSEVIKNLEQPVYGICIGQQLLCSYSEEGDTDCLGIFPYDVLGFDHNLTDRVPHMGWNTITNLEGPLFHGVPDRSYVYFVHSYYSQTNPDQIATTDYGVTFAAAMHKDNFYTSQFHPEKSAKIGSQILKNFLSLRP